MTRLAKLATGALSIVVVAAVTVCNGQVPKGHEGSYKPDAEVEITSDGKTITVKPLVALVSIADQKAHPFQWVIGKLPEGFTLEIDINAEGSRKGPFRRVKDGNGPWAMGRYTGSSEAKLK